MKYGRLPRTYDPRVPKLERVRAPKPLAPLPASVNYSVGMPADLGAMMNDTIGDCVEAAVGHAEQVWTFVAHGAMVTPSDADIEAFYGVAGGYVRGHPSTDNGTITQVALTDWLKVPVAGNRLAAFLEVEAINKDDVRRTIWECGGIMTGFNVPAYLVNLEAPGSVWDIDRGADNSIIGGHCVWIAGYRADGNLVVQSWGDWYTMTWAFWSKFVDEAYALANKDWIEKTGSTPAGLTLSELEALMQILKPGPVASVQRRHRHHRRAKRHLGTV
jgi:hypothetical protein